MYKSLFIREFVNFALGNKKKVEYKARIVKSLGNKYRYKGKEVAENQEESINKEADRLIEIINGFNNQRKEMAAIQWICNGRLRLPEDMSKLDEAVELMDRFKLDYTKFPGPVELINSVPMGKRARVVTGSGDPDSYSELELDYKVDTELGELKVYYVHDDKEGQMAVRNIMNTQRGKDWKGPWCLLRGDGVGGLDNNAWEYWSETYDTIKKRVAFLNGNIVAFCASESRDIEWWDLDDNPTSEIPLNEAKKQVLDGINLSELSEKCGNHFQRCEIWDSIKDRAVYKWGDLYEVHYYDEGTGKNYLELSLRGNMMFEWKTDDSSVKISVNEECSTFYISRYEKTGKDNKTIIKTYLENGDMSNWVESDVTTEKSYYMNGKLKTLKNLLDGTFTQWRFDGTKEVWKKTTPSSREWKHWDKNGLLIKESIIGKGMEIERDRNWSGGTRNRIWYKEAIGDDSESIYWTQDGDIISYTGTVENELNVVFENIASLMVDEFGAYWKGTDVVEVELETDIYEYHIRKKDGYWVLNVELKMMIGGRPQQGESNIKPYEEYQLDELPQSIVSLIDNIYKEHGKFVPKKYGMEGFFEKKDIEE